MEDTHAVVENHIKIKVLGIHIENMNVAKRKCLNVYIVILEHIVKAHYKCTYTGILN